MSEWTSAPTENKKPGLEKTARKDPARQGGASSIRASLPISV